MNEVGTFRFPPDQRHLRVLRKAVRARLDALRLTRARIDMVLLVLDEIVTNSIEHAGEYRRSSHLRVELRQDGDAIVFDFEDPDVPQDTVEQLARAFEAQQARPAPHFERGRGLFLLADSVDDLSIEAGPHGGLHLSGRVAKGLA